MVTNSKDIDQMIKDNILPEITDDNYYDDEINQNYMSFHMWLSLHGCDGVLKCEAKTMAEMKHEYVDEEEDDTALLIGSYVDAVLAGDDGELDKFKDAHPEIFVSRGENKGELKATYKMAEKMIERCQKDELFMGFMAGEKQRIFTAELWGIPFKCKIDSYMPFGKPIIVDLKTTRDMHKTFFRPDIGHIDFVSYYGYIYQLALYREIVKAVTGVSCKCYICAVSKGKHPDIQPIEVDDFSLDSAIDEIERSIKFSPLVDVWQGTAEPTRCESPSCPYCLDTKKSSLINYKDLIMTF